MLTQVCKKGGEQAMQVLKSLSFLLDLKTPWLSDQIPDVKLPNREEACFLIYPGPKSSYFSLTHTEVRSNTRQTLQHRWETMHAHSLSCTPLWPRRCCKSLIRVWVGLIRQTSKAELPITRACGPLHNRLDSTLDPDGANKGLKTHCESLSWREWNKKRF